MKKQRTLAFLSSHDAKYDRLKSTRASARDAKLKTTTVPTPTTSTETVALFSFMFIEEEGALLLGKTIQKYANQLIKTHLTRGRFGNNLRSLCRCQLYCSLFDSLFHHKLKNFGAYTRIGDSIFVSKRG